MTHQQVKELREAHDFPERWSLSTCIAAALEGAGIVEPGLMGIKAHEVIEQWLAAASEQPATEGQQGVTVLGASHDRDGHVQTYPLHIGGAAQPATPGKEMREMFDTRKFFVDFWGDPKPTDGELKILRLAYEAGAAAESRQSAGEPCKNCGLDELIHQVSCAKPSLSEMREALEALLKEWDEDASYPISKLATGDSLVQLLADHAATKACARDLRALLAAQQVGS